MRDEASVLDIVIACQRIEQFTRDADYQQFCQDEKMHWAVISQFNIIGEAVRRLSDEFKQLNNDVPWHDISSMRNRLIHEYDKIDFEIVWDSVKNSVPELLAYIKPLLSTRPTGD